MKILLLIMLLVPSFCFAKDAAYSDNLLSLERGGYPNEEEQWGEIPGNLDQNSLEITQTGAIFMYKDSNLHPIVKISNGGSKWDKIDVDKFSIEISCPDGYHIEGNMKDRVKERQCKHMMIGSSDCEKDKQNFVLTVCTSEASYVCGDMPVSTDATLKCVKDE